MWKMFEFYNITHFLSHPVMLNPFLINFLALFISNTAASIKASNSESVIVTPLILLETLITKSFSLGL